MTGERPKRKIIVIRTLADGVVVDNIDVTGKTPREIEMVERGLLRQIDRDRYSFAVREVPV